MSQTLSPKAFIRLALVLTAIVAGTWYSQARAEQMPAGMQKLAFNGLPAANTACVATPFSDWYEPPNNDRLVLFVTMSGCGGNLISYASTGSFVRSADADGFRFLLYRPLDDSTHGGGIAPVDLNEYVVTYTQGPISAMVGNTVFTGYPEGYVNFMGRVASKATVYQRDLSNAGLCGPSGCPYVNGTGMSGYYLIDKDIPALPGSAMIRIGTTDLVGIFVGSGGGQSILAGAEAIFRAAGDAGFSQKGLPDPHPQPQ